VANRAILKIFSSIQDFHSEKKTIVTIGTFDGVHIGHRKIIDRVTATAADCDCESALLTFFPHPRMVLPGHGDIRLLNTLDEKKLLLEKTGLDNLIIHAFNEAFAMLSAEEFVVSVLVNQMNVRKIIIGHDHRFGRNRDADINDLMVFGEKYGFEVEQIPVQEINDISVSSTKIRNALTNGDIMLANQYLGYNYFLSGTVIRDRQLGRTIGFPTANIRVGESYKLIPKQGVYVVEAAISGKSVFGMMNIGMRPTVDGTALSIEVHLFDFDHDIYDRDISVSFLHRLRDEQKFDSVALLREQLEHDKASSIAFLKKE
jgi:riboflavin kinase/FMN adenylyltransferase